MPSSPKSTFTFYDGDGKDYPFYALNEGRAIRMALEWARPRGIKLYRRRPQ